LETKTRAGAGKSEHTTAVSRADPSKSATASGLSEAPGHDNPARPALVSIGLPVYNGDSYLERAARSVLEQDYEQVELIIVDNASDDATPAIAERLAAADERVRYYRNPENVGAARNFCRAFELAQGPYFKWAAYDDWLEPNYVSACVDVLQRQPGTVLVFPGTNIYDETGQLLKRYRYPAGIMSDQVSRRFFHAVWNFKYTTAVFGLARTEALAQTSLIQPYSSSDRLMLAELVLLGDVREIDGYLFNLTETVTARRGRNTAWWTAEPQSHPTYDRWRLLGNYIRLVARRRNLSLRDRLQMTGTVLGFFARRWPRRALYRELRAGARHAWATRVATPAAEGTSSRRRAESRG
jgi:glycosyltransferase involved in cell wall biosynthesis